MPCLDKVPKEMTPPTPPPPSDESHNDGGVGGVEEEEEAAPTRELTQTDLLNNRLLKSFLDRMNTGGLAEQLVANGNSASSTPEEDDDF